MKKRVPVSIEDYAGHIMKCLPQGGCLLSTSYNDVLDTMTIGWGTIGVDWSMPILNVLCSRKSIHKDTAG